MYSNFGVHGQQQACAQTLTTLTWHPSPTIQRAPDEEALSMLEAYGRVEFRGTSSLPSPAGASLVRGGRPGPPLHVMWAIC